VFLPRTGIVPPELYDFADHKLIRRGSLSAYIKDSVTFQPTSGKLGAIEGKISSGKNLSAAIGFLKNALSALGLSSLPKIDLSFTGSKELVFAFTDVTYQSVDPAVLDGVLQGLKMPLAIPDKYVASGKLHIAYEYAYASKVTLSRSDGQNFSGNVSGGIGQYIDLGANGKVELTGNSRVSFSTSDDKTAAFAYKAGRLQTDGHRWTFEPEVVLRRTAAAAGKAAFIPAPDVVLRVEADGRLAG
jgi:hypothetical protein